MLDFPISFFFLVRLSNTSRWPLSMIRQTPPSTECPDHLRTRTRTHHQYQQTYTRDK